MSTLPTTPKGTAKVQPGRGVKVRGVYYWCNEFRAPEIEGKPVPVRYDPFDAGTAHAFVANRWVLCHSEYYSVLRGRSEKEMMLTTQELHKQHSGPNQCFVLNARRLAEFLQSVEAKEALLVQRARDREVREALGDAAGRPDDTGSVSPTKESVEERTPQASPTPVHQVGEEYGEF
jgi:hypothetical protein